MTESIGSFVWLGGARGEALEEIAELFPSILRRQKAAFQRRSGVVRLAELLFDGTPRRDGIARPLECTAQQRRHAHQVDTTSFCRRRDNAAKLEEIDEARRCAAMVQQVDQAIQGVDVVLVGGEAAFPRSDGAIVMSERGGESSRFSQRFASFGRIGLEARDAALDDIQAFHASNT